MKVRDADPPEVMARIKDGLHLVDAIASQLRRQLSTAIVREELVSFGREGLLAAARTFDASREVPFRCWAALRIRGAMIDGLRAQGSLPRRIYRAVKMIEEGDLAQEALVEERIAAPTPTPESADARVAAHLAGMATAMAMGLIRERTKGGEEVGVIDTATPEDLLGEAQLMHALREAVARLPPAERSLVEGHFFEGQTLEDAAKGLGLSKSWGSRLLARAIEAITRDLRRAKIVRR